MEFDEDSLYHEILTRESIRRYGEEEGRAKAKAQIRAIGRPGMGVEAIEKMRIHMRKRREATDAKVNES